jgi:hypothetical protein
MTAGLRRLSGYRERLNLLLCRVSLAVGGDPFAVRIAGINPRHTRRARLCYRCRCGCRRRASRQRGNCCEAHEADERD